MLLIMLLFGHWYTAEALGIPHLPPYLPYSSKKFRRGANFAVGGATALDTDSFTQLGIPLYTPYSLNVQLSWFRQLLPSICPSQSGNQSSNISLLCMKLIISIGRWVTCWFSLKFVIGLYVLIDCPARLRWTLFMGGEIGGNDYGHGFQQGWSIQQVNRLVPKVIGVTASAVTISSTGAGLLHE